MKKILELIETGKTVFSKSDLKMYWSFSTQDAFDIYVYRAIKKGLLIKLSYGIYGLKNYNIFELASKLKKKSYISLETILKQEGIIFQYYESIFSISDNSLEKKIQGQKFVYKKIRDDILLNPIGIIQKNNVMIASAERAICDRIYLSKNYYFDNLSRVDFEKLSDISQIYNKRVIVEIKKIIDYENTQRKT